MDARGRLCLEPVRAWPGTAGGEVVVRDEADRPRGDERALAAALAAAEARATATEDRPRQLEAELRRPPGQPGA